MALAARLSAGIPAVIVLVARVGTPESPRWLPGKGRIAEAKSVVLSTSAKTSRSTAAMTNTRRHRAGSCVSSKKT
ncbi:MAG: Inner membrane metabolite transport protein YgcS [uncultured Paraburkholderia sp.]|nr:MAG: Inner membrane metabolite transport protein YgcS [uncultured Paraburkholderia sp.]CAH2787256.1 MAG: Inner membrane metabolite transport protein YgcS [uncultured Paraburkholderia sp.]CAH2921268.1 MAG: Inner membrane metabolite transport protein YgcS [uncultured Paraburkholderia sp.]CAH2922113.1 MAG: Inner membrane metabolite transport protein YgcS [uncultured Paraburkholderia sp.]